MPFHDPERGDQPWPWDFDVPTCGMGPYWMAHLWDNVALFVALTTIREMLRDEELRQVRAEAGHP